MISDTLFEAVEEIARYRRDKPFADIYSSSDWTDASGVKVADKLDSLVEHMEDVRRFLDAYPRAQEIAKDAQEFSQRLAGEAEQRAREEDAVDLQALVDLGLIERVPVGRAR